MEDNNNQSIPEFKKKNPIVEKLKQVRKKTLYIWIIALAVLFGSAAMMYSAQAGQTLEAQETIESLEEEIEQLNDQYDALASDNEELRSQLEEYQDQQATIDELNGKLTELQKQNDTLKAENEKLKTENESLKSQLADKESSGQSSGNAGGRLVDNSDSDEMVWLSETGSKYHSIPDCGRMDPNNSWQVSRSSAEAQGYDACKKCF